MQTHQMDKVWVVENAAPVVRNRNAVYWIALFFYPVGVVRVWGSRKRIWIKLLYTICGLPLLLFMSAYASIIIFGAFLPSLDRKVGHRSDRTIVNSEGNYAVTFIKTGDETH